MNRACRVASVFLPALALPAFAQPPSPEPANLRGDSTQTRKRLTEAEQKLTGGQAAEAVDALQRILDDAGDDLVSADGRQYRPARHFAHAILARLPADVLKTYQDRLDAPALKLLEAAKRTRDPAPLRQLLDRYFVSRPSDEGLLLLGDLLFEQGEFRGAEQAWGRLLPGGADLTYPNPKADPAAVTARMTLAAIFAGDTSRAKAALAAFKAKYPDAKGPFAGKVGPYADALQAALDNPPRVPQAAARGTDWPTFGGGPDRADRVGVRFPNYWPDGTPTWEKTLPTLPRHNKAPAGPPARPPLGHPVIAGGRVFVTDGTGLFGFDLLTGKPLKLPNRSGGMPLFDPEKALPDASPSLTAAGDRVYVRIGPPLVRPPDAAKLGRAVEETAIVCFGPGTGTTDLRELWRLNPPGDTKTPIVWEGAPLVAGRRLWAVHARFEGGRVVQGIECYDPADATAKPLAPAWSADVCDSPIPNGGDPRARQELLTLAGRNVVFCSNAGAVVALDAATGRRAWGFRYPRSRKADANRSPDPAPAVYASGRVFVAPADADRVYALDPETGGLLWESGPTEGAQIVGTAAGKLIVATAGPARGLRGLNVASGSHREPEGWVLHDGGGLLSYGHGFVTDDAVVWPTRAGLCLLRPGDGSLLSHPFLNHLGGLQSRFFGNVAYADGVLVVVTPTQIWGYVTEEKRFGHLKERSERDPVRARFEQLVLKAEESLAAGDGAAAEELLRAAAGEEFPKPLRAWAVARRLLLTPPTTDESKLPAALRTALTPELLAEWLVPPDGTPVTLETLVLRHTGRAPAPTFPPTSPSPEGERKPDDAPSLAADAEIARTLRLPPNAAPLRWLSGVEGPPKRLFATTTDEVFAVTLGAGELTRFTAVAPFTHAADIREGFVTAGPFAVAVYTSGRLPVWVFRVPATAPLPASPGEFRLANGDSPSVPELSAFHLAGSWLVARLGDNHLIALDLKGRRVAWVLGTSGKHGFRPLSLPDAVRFTPAFAVAGRLIVAQLSDGRRWFLRAESGKVLDIPGFDHPTAKSAWVLPPAEVEANRLAVSDGPGLVRMLNLATGRVKWTHQEDREASLAGEPPQVRAWGGNILVAVRRNHGVELDRLDMSDGRSMWKDGPAFLDASCAALANADADAERLYAPAGNTLTAVTLKDGKPAWEAELPPMNGAGGWVVRAGKNCVIAYPDAAIPREPVGDVFARLVRSFRTDPRAERLPTLAAGLYDAWVVRTVPVLLFDPETGKPLNRFDIPAPGPAVTAWFERDLAVVATADRICWLR